MTRRIAAVVAGVVFVACWAVVPASAQAAAWSVVPSPNRGSDGFGAVSCVSADACMAVGGRAGRGGAGLTLAEWWDGSRWAVLPSPSRRPPVTSDLLGVSCTSPSACMAVGESGLTGGASQLSGSAQKTLTERWDGSRWAIVPSPDPASSIGTVLYGVSCAAADACMAVGSFGTSSGGGSTLVESWDGSRWAIVPSPNPVTGSGALFGVSCISDDACTAVGLAASGNNLAGTLTESWDGSRWAIVPSPNPVTGPGRLASVSCVSADACTAAGVYWTSKNQALTLVESWDGSHWAIVPSPSPSRGTNWLNGVSCASRDACAVAGYYFSNSGQQTLVETWDGSRWSVVPSPSPGVIDHVLTGVSCVSETSCTATGYYYDTSPSPADRTLVETGPASG